jgi:hypothetical protein
MGVSAAIFVEWLAVGVVLLAVPTAGLELSSCPTSREEVSAAAASLKRWEQQLHDVQNSVRDARRVLSAKQLQLAECEASSANAHVGTDASDPSASGDGHMLKRSMQTKARDLPEASAQLPAELPEARRYRGESDDQGENPMDEKKALAYGAHCWGANSSFADPSACGCLNTSRHQAFDSRPTIRIIVGMWTAAVLDSWLLKIVIEQEMGWPVQLLPDVQFNHLEGKSFEALGTGKAEIYPEVGCVTSAYCIPAFVEALHCRCGNRRKASCSTHGFVRRKRSRLGC